MRKANGLRGRMRGGILAFLLAIGIFATGFCMASLTGYAAGQAKVTAPNGAKIRESADTASTMVGGAEKDKVLSVLGQTQGADGYTWYQVQVNDTTTGFVRADLVEVSGDIPAGTVGDGGGENAGDGENAGGGESAPPVEVTQVNPVSATIEGEGVEIRDSASLAGGVLGTVPGETAVTVTGYVTDAEGTTWYQANYISGETQVEGFLLADACRLSADLVPLGQEPAGNETSPEPTQEPEPERYKLVQNNGEWLLVDNVEDPGNGYSVEKLMSGLQNNAQMYFDSEAKVKSQKIIIIVLVFLLVAAVAGIAFLVFKIRDMMDSAYFNEVENETLRRKNASGNSGKQKPAMHTVGPKDQPPRTAGPRPAERPAGSAGQKPAAAAGQRIAGPEARGSSGIQGQRAAGRSAGTRPAGSVQGQRPAQGTRPVGGAQGHRGTGAAPRTGGTQGQRPIGAPQGARRTEGPQPKAPQGARPVQGAQKAQPKNFMADDDEFEFEFLNYDGDEE
ncbi:MAG: SH3 domain-containing protein [Lachnospiraceae bacterium]|nr:SH3 domain-containing protein [uncultured Acetatifactor sp.]MCI8543498.1 SH3 domain-containing protein [Lachnospiraceae bacterium]